MSHDTHATPADTKPGSSFTSSVWFTLILAGLFICAVNFVEVMSHDDGGHGTEGHSTEHAAPHHSEDASHDTHGDEPHEEAHH